MAAFRRPYGKRNNLKRIGNTPEKQIENAILEYLNMKNIFAWKVKTMGTFDPQTKTFRAPSKYYLKGQPDITAILPGGKFLGIEVKSKLGRLSEHQKIFHLRIRQAGGLAIVARSVGDVEAFLNEREPLELEASDFL